MSELYEGLMQGLQEAIAIQKGELKGKKTVYIVDPVEKYSNTEFRTLRMELGMSQEILAEYMGVSKKTVEAWEAGTNKISGPACRLMSVMLLNKDNIPYVSVK